GPSLRAAIVIVLAVAAVGLVRAGPAAACPVTSLGPGSFGCNATQLLDPPCPSFADGKTTYLNFFNIPGWAMNPMFSVMDSGVPLGPSHSPCPNSTLSGLVGQDNASGGSPPAGDRAFEIDFSITPQS